MTSIDDITSSFSTELGEALESRPIVTVIGVREYPNIETDTLYAVRVKIDGNKYAIVRKSGVWRGEDGDVVVSEDSNPMVVVRDLVTYTNSNPNN
jgi:hypothetical protein